MVRASSSSAAAVLKMARDEVVCPKASALLSPRLSPRKAPGALKPISSPRVRPLGSARTRSPRRAKAMKEKKRKALAQQASYPPPFPPVKPQGNATTSPRKKMEHVKQGETVHVPFQATSEKLVSGFGKEMDAAVDDFLSSEFKIATESAQSSDADKKSLDRLTADFFEEQCRIVTASDEDATNADSKTKTAKEVDPRKMEFKPNPPKTPAPIVSHTQYAAEVANGVFSKLTTDLLMYDPSPQQLPQFLEQCLLNTPLAGEGYAPNIRLAQAAKQRDRTVDPATLMSVSSRQVFDNLALRAMGEKPADLVAHLLAVVRDAGEMATLLDATETNPLLVTAQEEEEEQEEEAELAVQSLMAEVAVEVAAEESGRNLDDNFTISSSTVLDIGITTVGVDKPLTSGVGVDATVKGYLDAQFKITLQSLELDAAAGAVKTDTVDDGASKKATGIIVK